MRPLVDDRVHPLVKIALLPITLPLAAVLLVLEAVEQATWKPRRTLRVKVEIAAWRWFGVDLG